MSLSCLKKKMQRVNKLGNVSEVFEEGSYEGHRDQWQSEKRMEYGYHG
jgi:hypothetical protein